MDLINNRTEREGWGPIEVRVEASHHDRKKRGAFYTPWDIAVSLCEAVVSARPTHQWSRLLESELVVGDPFSGVGILIAALIERLAVLASPGSDSLRRHLLTNLVGFDLEGGTLEEARRLLVNGLPVEERARAGKALRLHRVDTLLTPADELCGLTAAEDQGRGFDVLVSNPPWEKVRVNDREFFSHYRDDFSRLGRAQRLDEKARLLSDAGIATAYATYQDNVRKLKSAAKLRYRSSAAGGDIDTYKLAVERAIELLAPGGIAGLIVPHGVLGDWGARKLRELMLDEVLIHKIVRFETGPELFPEIHANLGIVFLVFSKPDNDTQTTASQAKDHLSSTC
ncbi:MAG: hypothetical protein KC561_13165, partial [Myxococcales bacterium]|nr:hypothetical protein [Myxococcales bacterium]